MDNMTVRQNGKLTFTVNRADDDAVSATFIMQLDDLIVTETVAYDSDGLALFDIDDTSVVGVYQYQINENFESGNPDIYPNLDDCDGDCDLPEVEICESLPISGSS